MTKCIVFFEDHHVTLGCLAYKTTLHLVLLLDCILQQNKEIMHINLRGEIDLKCTVWSTDDHISKSTCTM